MDWKPVTLSAAPLDQSWYEASARARLAGLLDPESFEEFIGPEQRMMSPHLPLFDLPRAFDDGMIVGHGLLEAQPVLVAAQEGRFMGGAFGEVHGAKLVGLLRAAPSVKPEAVLILFDTGGVRLQEANAGEIAIAEIMRAIAEARLDGVRSTLASCAATVPASNKSKVTKPQVVFRLIFLGPPLTSFVSLPADSHNRSASSIFAGGGFTPTGTRSSLKTPTAVSFGERASPSRLKRPFWRRHHKQSWCAH